MVTARIIKIRGKVQGVNFRYYTLLEARKLGLSGLVKNVDDGSVQITVEGEFAAVESLIRWCHKGPLLARVDSVETEEIKVSGYKDFVIVR